MLVAMGQSECAILECALSCCAFWTPHVHQQALPAISASDNQSDYSLQVLVRHFSDRGSND